jgi:hypothetical protein
MNHALKENYFFGDERQYAWHRLLRRITFIVPLSVELK